LPALNQSLQEEPARSSFVTREDKTLTKPSPSTPPTSAPISRLECSSSLRPLRYNELVSVDGGEAPLYSALRSQSGLTSIGGVPPEGFVRQAFRVYPGALGHPVHRRPARSRAVPPSLVRASSCRRRPRRPVGKNARPRGARQERSLPRRRRPRRSPQSNPSVLVPTRVARTDHPLDFSPSPPVRVNSEST